MATPISTAIKFNGVTEITLTPTENKDKELLALAVRGNSTTKVELLADGAVRFTLAPEAPQVP